MRVFELIRRVRVIALGVRCFLFGGGFVCGLRLVLGFVGGVSGWVRFTGWVGRVLGVGVGGWVFREGSVGECRGVGGGSS